MLKKTLFSKNLFLLLSLVIGLFFFWGLSMASLTLENSSSNNTSDVYFKKGEVTGLDPSDTTKTITRTDFCTNCNSTAPVETGACLNEFYLDNGFVKNEKVVCAGDCNDGACLDCPSKKIPLVHVDGNNPYKYDNIPDPVRGYVPSKIKPIVTSSDGKTIKVGIDEFEDFVDLYVCYGKEDGTATKRYCLNSSGQFVEYGMSDMPQPYIANTVGNITKTLNFNSLVSEGGKQQIGLTAFKAGKKDANSGFWATTFELPIVIKAPTNVSASGSGNNVKIYWTPSISKNISYYSLTFKCADGFSPCFGYNFTVNGTEKSVLYPNPTDILSGHGLSDGESYLITIQACDIQGNCSPESDPAYKFTYRNGGSSGCNETCASRGYECGYVCGVACGNNGACFNGNTCLSNGKCNNNSGFEIACHDGDKTDYGPNFTYNGYESTNDISVFTKSAAIVRDSKGIEYNNVPDYCTVDSSGVDISTYKKGEYLMEQACEPGSTNIGGFFYHCAFGCENGACINEGMMNPIEQKVYYTGKHEYVKSSSNPDSARPIGIGSAMADGGLLNWTIGAKFEGLNDLYLAFTYSGDPNKDIYFLDNSGKFVAWSMVKNEKNVSNFVWKEKVKGDFSASIFREDANNKLPAGTYDLYLMSVPRGTDFSMIENGTAKYYIWHSAFTR